MRPIRIGVPRFGRISSLDGNARGGGLGRSGGVNRWDRRVGRNALGWYGLGWRDPGWYGLGWSASCWRDVCWNRRRGRFVRYGEESR